MPNLGRNDLTLDKRLVEVRDQLQNLQAESQDSQHSLKVQMGQSTERVDKGFSRLSRAVQSKSKLMDSHHRSTTARLRDIQGKTASNEKQTRMTLEGQRLVMNSQDCVQSMQCNLQMSMSSLHQRIAHSDSRLARSVTSVSGGIAKVDSTLESINTKLTSLTIGVLSSDYKPSVIFHGSPADAIPPLSLLNQKLSQVLSNLVEGRERVPSKNSTHWLRGEFQRVYGEALTEAGKVMRLRAECSRSGIATHHESPLHTTGPYSSIGHQGKKKKIDSEIRGQPPAKKILQDGAFSRSIFHLNLDFGQLVLVLEEESDLTSEGKRSAIPASVRAQICFIPMSSIKVGLLAEFWRDLRLEMNVKASLSTFAVVESESGVAKCVRRGDIDGVKDLFRSRKAAPSDRIFSGLSLFWLAVEYGHLEMCRFLIQQGADTNNCDRLGRSVLASTAWYREVRNPPSIKAEIELLRFMVDCSDVNLDFEQSELLGPVWLRFWFKIIQDDYPNAKDRETMQSFIIKTMLPDRGLRNAAGCTMLTQTLRSLAMVVREESYCIPIKGGYDAMVASVKLMLDEGADGDAQDRDGNGALHHLVGYPEPGFERISEYFVGYQLPVAILYELQTQLRCLRLLVRSGCDLNLRNSAGYTPSDLALWTPLMWYCWCLVVEENGHDLVETVLQDEQGTLSEDTGLQQGDRYLNDSTNGYPFDCWSLRCVTINGYDYISVTPQAWLKWFMVPKSDDDSDIWPHCTKGCRKDSSSQTFNAYLDYRELETKRLSPHAIPRKSLITWEDFSRRKRTALQLYQEGVLQDWWWYPKVNSDDLKDCFVDGDICSSKVEDLRAYLEVEAQEEDEEDTEEYESEDCEQFEHRNDELEDERQEQEEDEYQENGSD